MPETRTEYERDADGNIVASVSVTESEWDEQEQAWMLALAAWRMSRCPGCGGNLAETTDPANEEQYRTETSRCHRCTAQAITAAQFQVPEVTAPQAILYTTRLRNRR